jgi:hypothetical protein
MSIFFLGFMTGLVVQATIGTLIAMNIERFTAESRLQHEGVAPKIKGDQIVLRITVVILIVFIFWYLYSLSHYPYIP